MSQIDQEGLGAQVPKSHYEVIPFISVGQLSEEARNELEAAEHYLHDEDLILIVTEEDWPEVWKDCTELEMQEFIIERWGVSSIRLAIEGT